MALFRRTTPEEREEQEQKALRYGKALDAHERAEREHERAVEEWRAANDKWEKYLETPKGAANAARHAGHKVFQYMDVLDVTKALVVPLVGAFTEGKSGPVTAKRPVIEQIESQGWKLENVGYVFQETGSESRDKFLASGQQIAVSGRVLAYYLFRATSLAPLEPAVPMPPPKPGPAPVFDYRITRDSE